VLRDSPINSHNLMNVMGSDVFLILWLMVIEEPHDNLDFINTMKKITCKFLALWLLRKYEARQS